MFGFFNKKKSLLESGILKGSADVHSHILFGVDDGERTSDESLATLKYLEEAGVSTLWLTPHIMEDVPNTTDSLKDRFAELKKLYSGSMKLLLSAENMMDNLYHERLQAGDLLEHGEGYVLVETSTLAPPMDFDDVIDSTMKAGFRPILAHPERYIYMNDEDYDRLHERGVLFQMNIPSIIGGYGETAQAKAQHLLDKGYYSMAGSDCHRLHFIMHQYEAKVLSSKTLGQLDAILHQD
jgi:tyrosine-protein phosphatase YwqE